MSRHRQTNAKNKKTSLSIAQKTIVLVIGLLFILIAVLSISLFFLNTESRVKNTISSIATDYYENYIYENIINSEKVEEFDKIMENYEHFGFSAIYLRQLLYYNNNPETIDFIKQYCDENKTSVKFYPNPPYSRTSYRAEYTYFCNFEL